MRGALTNLHTLSNETASRLDNAYWRVLEKVSELQRTIAAMKELATMARELDGQFKRESEEIVTEVETAMQGFEGFEGQQVRIQDLAQRVKAGREKIKSLGDRVEVVKGKVDGWERMESEWQETARKRLKVLWIVIAVFGVMFLGTMVFQMTPARTAVPEILHGMNGSALLPNFEVMGNESGSFQRDGGKVEEKIMEKTESQKRMDEDPRLRMFDEL